MRGGLERFSSGNGPPPQDSDAATREGRFWEGPSTMRHPNEEQQMSAGDVSASSSSLINMPPSTASSSTKTTENHNKRSSPTDVKWCAFCKRDLFDRFIMHVYPNLHFHAACLKCAECNRFLDETSNAFVKNGRTLCKDDYMRQYGRKCSRCSVFFSSNELVMHARHLIFHLDCFACSTCNKPFKTGDEYMLEGHSVICRAECSVQDRAGGTGQPPSAVNASMILRENNMLVQRRQSSVTPSLFSDDDPWSDRQRRDSDLLVDTPAPTITSPTISMKSDELSMSPMMSHSGSKKKKDKQTRVRTVLNENQLAILKKIYHTNPRPDAVLKEQLVEMTGLNARVIRVWFQNKRCKDKKRQIQLRDSEMSAQRERTLSNVRLSGVGPLLTSSPSPHIDNVLSSAAIEIQQFAQWVPSEPPEQHSFPQHLSYTELGNSDIGRGFMMGGSNPFQAGAPPRQFPPTGPFSPHLLNSSDLSSPSCSE